MKKVLLTGSMITGIIALSLTGCYNDNREDLYPQPPISSCDTSVTAFAATIQPIITQNCALSGCHSGSAPAAGYDFTTYGGVKASVDAGRLLGALKHESGYSSMPKNGTKLPDCEILKIETWKNRGAKNN